MESGAQVTGFSRLELLSKNLGEGEAIALRRKDYLNAYFETPFETNQIFLKNYERPQSDPISYNLISDSTSDKLLPDKLFDIGCVGTEVYVRRSREDFYFSDGDDGGESKVLPDKIPPQADRMELLNGALRNSFQTIRVEKSEAFRNPL